VKTTFTAHIAAIGRTVIVDTSLARPAVVGFFAIPSDSASTADASSWKPQLGTSGIDRNVLAGIFLFQKSKQLVAFTFGEKFSHSCIFNTTCFEKSKKLTPPYKICKEGDGYFS